MITRLVLFFTIILVWEGCDVVKPRAQGADNELVVVTSFEDRDAIQTVLTTIFNDTLYTPQPEPYYRRVWADPENFNDVKNHVNVIVAAFGENPRNLGVKLVKNLL